MRDYRGDFPEFAPTVYLNCAYQGPFPRASLARLERAIELKCHPERMVEPEYVDLPDRVRARLAALVGADASEIALTGSATQGIGIVASGLDLGAGDEVVVAGTNFPSNLFTWLHLRRRGILVRMVKPAERCVRLEEVAAALTPRTRVLALDWVAYDTGARIDLSAFGEIAHHSGAIFVVDGTQGVGALEVDLHRLPVDAMAIAAYKWLLGPYGTGFAYLSHELQDRLDLPVINWLTVEGSERFDDLPVEDFTLPRAARIFDAAETSNFLNLYPLEASLEYVSDVTVPVAYQHSTRLLDRLAVGLGELGYAPFPAPGDAIRSTILTFSADSPERTAALHARLKARHVAVSLRHGAIRVSPYLYNDAEDIDQFLSVVRDP